MVLGKSTFPPEGENNLPVCVEGEGRLCIMEFVPDLWGGGVTFFLHRVSILWTWIWLF